MARSLIRAGLFCGVLAPLLWAATIIVVGELRPGFDHVGQYISELGERGSPHAGLMRYGGFVASGLLHIAYAAAFYATLVRLTGRQCLSLLVAALIALNGLGRIGAGLFACAPGCAAPDVFEQRLHSLSATGIAGLLFLGLMSAGEVGRVGLHERLASGVLSLWILLTALRLAAGERDLADSG